MITLTFETDASLANAICVQAGLQSWRIAMVGDRIRIVPTDPMTLRAGRARAKKIIKSAIGFIRRAR